MGGLLHAAVFEACDRLVEEGSIRAYGVSVEKVEEALKAIEYPGVATVQIIFNVFRQRPAALFFEQAKARDVGVIARVPLASGLLTGKFTRESSFGADDHRLFNRHGESFDVGETFSGVDYETGLDAVEELRSLVPEGATLAQLALRWILMFDAVSTAIPGAKTPEQARANAAAADLPPLSDETMDADRGALRRADRAARPPALVTASGRAGSSARRRTASASSAARAGPAGPSPCAPSTRPAA